MRYEKSVIKKDNTYHNSKTAPPPPTPATMAVVHPLFIFNNT